MGKKRFISLLLLFVSFLSNFVSLLALLRMRGRFLLIQVRTEDPTHTSLAVCPYAYRFATPIISFLIEEEA